ncbi:hypothetical protein TNIN_239661 [Trichonephila inaurata madagascariensis]|uniref:Uncharacterized protein n=1 Tax=Trichonephila inaurata madagascariensis TaxID=2747483 RepID=A0A8X6XLC9_9ARAC|nr:hypothetical protein TNIN_239661 [Trichonephila inaurata madagascariensis]
MAGNTNQSSTSTTQPRLLNRKKEEKPEISKDESTAVNRPIHESHPNLTSDTEPAYWTTNQRTKKEKWEDSRLQRSHLYGLTCEGKSSERTLLVFSFPRSFSLEGNFCSDENSFPKLKTVSSNT